MVSKGGATVRVLAGRSMGTDGPIALRNPGLLLDVHLSPGASFTQEVAQLTNTQSCTLSCWCLAVCELDLSSL